MSVQFQRDLSGVNWDELAGIYSKCFGMKGSADEVRAEFEGSDYVCIAMADGRAIGGGHAISDGVRDGAIYGVAVDPEWRNRGVGTSIVQELLNDLKNVSVVLNA